MKTFDNHIQSTECYQSVPTCSSVHMSSVGVASLDLHMSLSRRSSHLTSGLDSPNARLESQLVDLSWVTRKIARCTEYVARSF